MPREQLELAPGELVAREARSHHDLPDDADGGLWANLVMMGVMGDGFLGGDGGSEGLGLLVPRGGWIPSYAEQLSPLLWCARPSSDFCCSRPPECARVAICKVVSVGIFYDSNVCHIAPRVLEKRPVHALSALVENMKALMGCE